MNDLMSNPERREQVTKWAEENAHKTAIVGSLTWAANNLFDALDALATLEERKAELEKQLDAGDSWAWIRAKFENAGRNYRWFKPREWANRDSLVGTRYEVMGWLHCIFGEADSARTYLEICLEQQKRADEAEAERDALKAWKREYLMVESEWDEQEVGKALGITLGASVRKGILPGILALKVDLQSAEQHLENGEEMYIAVRDRCARTELQLQEAEEKIRGLEALIAATGQEPPAAIFTTTT
jgi:hypothetical protein